MVIQDTRYGPSTLATVNTCAYASAVGSSIGTAVGVSVSVTFVVVSFSMGVLVASVLCYISERRSKESSHKPSSHVDPSTMYEVSTNKKLKEDADQ